MPDMVDRQATTYPSTTPFVTDGGFHEKPSVWDEITLMVKFRGGPGTEQERENGNMMLHPYARCDIQKHATDKVLISHG